MSDAIELFYNGLIYVALMLSIGVSIASASAASHLWRQRDEETLVPMAPTKRKMKLVTYCIGSFICASIALGYSLIVLNLVSEDLASFMFRPLTIGLMSAFGALVVMNST